MAVGRGANMSHTHMKLQEAPQSSEIPYGFPTLKNKKKFPQKK